MNSFTAPLNSRVDTRLPEETPNEDNDELSSIDAYFASLEKKNEVFQRPKEVKITVKNKNPNQR